MTPRVSVVMPVLSPDARYFPQAVESVLAQTMADWELIVVEDPSPTSAGEMLARYGDPRIRHIRNAERTSFAAQCNRGLDEARCGLIARFDADDVCHRDRLQKQADYLNSHADVDLLGSHLEVIDTEGKLLGYRYYPLDHEAIFKAMPRFNPVPHPAVMYRKGKILKAGGYVPTRHPGTEDYDLWSRVAKQGARFATYPEPLISYRVHPQATKTMKLRGSILGTLEVKETYWRDQMDFAARMRMWGEKVLLWLPPRLVLRLFMATQFTRRGP
jgi:glycosyltransferase involved in cell wall biosynthesis